VFYIVQSSPSSPPDRTRLHECSPSGFLDWTGTLWRMLRLMDCSRLPNMLRIVGDSVMDRRRNKSRAESNEIVIVRYISKRYYCKSSSKRTFNIPFTALMSSRVPAINPSLCHLFQHPKASRSSSPILHWQSTSMISAPLKLVPALHP
jgi:hypothetical protein